VLPPGVGGKYDSVEESLDVCSLLPDEGLENDPCEFENDNMARQNEEAE